MPCARSPALDLNANLVTGVIAVRRQRGTNPHLLKTQPTPSHAYDPNAVTRARITTAFRDKTSNRYDASSGQITTGIKDVTHMRSTKCVFPSRCGCSIPQIVQCRRFDPRAAAARPAWGSSNGMTCAQTMRRSADPSPENAIQIVPNRRSNRFPAP